MTRIRATRRYVVHHMGRDRFEGTYKQCMKFGNKSGLRDWEVEERDRNNIVIRIWDHTGKLRFKI